MKKILLMSLVFGCAGISSAWSDTNSPGIDWREHHQMNRIGQGVRQGDLTRGESRHLMRQQVRTRRMEHRFKADGNLTRGERFRMHRQLNRNSRSIYRARNNGRRRR